MKNKEALLALLRTLPGKAFNSENDFASKVVPQFVNLLGYDEAETFYEYGAGRYSADVVLAETISSKPWMVLELKRGKPKNLGDWTFQVRRYLEVFDCQLGALLSPDMLLIIDESQVRRFDLKDINKVQIEEILKTISRGVQTHFEEDESPKRRLIELIEAVELADTNNNKGKSLEDLAKFLFDATPSLSCKYANLLTRSSEIDLVIEYDASVGRLPIFEELGRYCLVECKNWSKPVGVGPVRDFMGKLDKCRVRLGIIFSKNGVTGVDSGADALREIQSRFDRDGVSLIVFSLEDLKGIDDGEDFYSALDKKADNLRFDAQGC